MGKKLYITEKPSVAGSFAEVLGIEISRSDRGRGYAEQGENIISWCYGHLVTMAYPDAYDAAYKAWRPEHLPIIPEQYKYVVVEDGGASKQFEVVSKLMNRGDVDAIYSCTDSGREGEYIFRLVLDMSGAQKPVKRVWISSHTGDSVKRGIETAKPLEEYDSLGTAAYSRAIEDWLFGMNFSRAYTIKFGRELSNRVKESKPSVIAIGRVMTCVLGLVVDRELEIRNFIPKTHYGVTASFLSNDSQVTYTGKWVQGKVEEKETANPEEKYISKEEAQALIEKVKDKTGEIKKVEIKTKKEQPPLLFNLAELQSEATKKFKIPVDKTLEIAQKLYERKLISYPRTDSRVLSTDVVAELPKILNGIYKSSDYREVIQRIKDFGQIKINASNKRYVDDSKISDHYAIIPTYETAELNRLDSDTAKIYNLIVKRFLAAFYPPAVFNTVRVETLVDGELFVSNAKSLKESGWKEIYEIAAPKNDEEITDSPIQNLKKKEKCEIKDFKLEEKETKPPTRYTDGSLIITMEKAGKFIENEELREQIKTSGIGTSATRAGIIKKLENIGYIDIANKTQIVTPTVKGEAIVEIVRRTAKELLNPALTASWEKGLIMIENNETSEEVFRDKLYGYIRRTIGKVL
ncbi:MAG: topoisomerase type central domain protein [Clostridiales bacterium]|nr:topoisomerase type central domain protein [Clostridiales bacterium]